MQLGAAGYQSLSRLWRTQGKRSDARALLTERDGWSTEGFNTADVQAAKSLLQELGGERPGRTNHQAAPLQPVPCRAEARPTADTVGWA
jgi:hypothetical protein